RLRILSGMLSKDELNQVYELSHKHQVKLIHLTTRQAIQFHHLTLDDVCNIMKEALSYDIYTRGAGGNFPRNVAMSPLTGVEVGEAFDVSPYATLCNQYFIKRITSYHLPRKFKVSFSNSEEDTAHATVQDLGFMAVEKEGQPYFKVYGGGGLGKNPRKGLVLEEYAHPEDTLYYVQAMLDLFTSEGNYENHNKARIRYMVDKLGEDGFIAAYKKCYDVLKHQGNLNLDLPVSAKINKQSADLLDQPDLIKQKQDGLYSVYLHPVGGELLTENLKEIVDFIAPIDAVEMRLGMTEGMYFLNLTATEAKGLLKLIAPINTTKKLEQSVACIGVPVCQMGILHSQETLKKIISYFKEKQYDHDLMPSIYISGCSNSCGVHQIGQIGLTGKLKKVEGASRACFELFMDGNVHDDEVRLGKSFGDIKEEDIPVLLFEISEQLKKTNSSFEQYYKQSLHVIQEIVKKYNV
ncbi:MAG: nitrite/sulfite reductase, partial [Turicibacter sp.]